MFNEIMHGVLFLNDDENRFVLNKCEYYLLEQKSFQRRLDFQRIIHKLQNFLQREFFTKYIYSKVRHE